MGYAGFARYLLQRYIEYHVKWSFKLQICYVSTHDFVSVIDEFMKYSIFMMICQVDYNVNIYISNFDDQLGQIVLQNVYDVNLMYWSY